MLIQQQVKIATWKALSMESIKWKTSRERDINFRKAAGRSLNSQSQKGYERIRFGKYSHSYPCFKF